MPKCVKLCRRFNPKPKAFGVKYATHYFCRTCRCWIPKNKAKLVVGKEKHFVRPRCPCCNSELRAKPRDRSHFKEKVTKVRYQKHF